MIKGTEKHTKKCKTSNICELLGDIWTKWILYSYEEVLRFCYSNNGAALFSVKDSWLKNLQVKWDDIRDLHCISMGS